MPIYNIVAATLNRQNEVMKVRGQSTPHADRQARPATGCADSDMSCAISMMQRLMPVLPLLSAC